MEDFLEQLASKSPTPGGGSVSALMGALGFSLLSMVCRLTIGKEKYKDVEEDLKMIAEETEEGRTKLTSLIEEDARAFDGVMAAFKMPKGEERKEAIQKALLQACLVPLETMKLAFRGLEIAKTCAQKGNRNALSDVGVGALALQTTARGAAMNIMINLSSLKEGGKEIQSEMEEILEKSKLLSDQVIREVEEIILAP
jgi:formiminotetrahydrofolate cyclodeaminase